MNFVLKIFHYRFYLKEFLLLFFTYLLLEGIFSWLFIPNSIIIEGYQKILSLIIYAFMLYKFDSLKKSDRIIIAIFTVLMIKLIFESYIKYDSFFRQLTMFTVLFPIVFILFVKYLLNYLEIDLLGFIARFYLVTYIIFMLLYGRGFSFSLDSVEMNDYGPFSGDTRVIHASHIFMIIIPFIWYMNEFITTKKNKFIIPVLFCLLIIIVHQHRSVWSSAIVAFFFYFLATIRNQKKTLSAFWNISIGVALSIIVAYFFISNLFPGFVDFLGDRFSEIFDPSKEGSTGNFRIQQREVYSELFLQRPIFGWTFEGFEMPNPLVDWWPENTGQHFHEGYMEMLFYHGIVGFIFKYGFLFYLLIRSFSRKLSQQTIILISFCISGLVFSFNYVLPVIFWGHVGMCFYYLEKDDAKAIGVENEVEIINRNSLTYNKTI